MNSDQSEIPVRGWSVGKRRDLTWGVAVFFLVLWAILTHTHIDSWNEFSRLASAEALVEQGTWIIDNTALGKLTGDHVFLNGHYYSGEPPVFSFVATGVYAVLHHGLHLSFDSSECDARAVTCYCFAFQCPQPFDWAYYLITLILVGVPSALMLALFYRSTALYGLSNLLALALTAVLGLGTLVLPFSLVFANHVPTSACLSTGLYAMLRSRTDGPSSRRWLLVAGFVIALASTLELVTGIFLVLMFGVAVLRHRRQAWPFVLGSVVPVVIMAALDWWILGDPLPPQLHPAGYNYPGSTLYATVAGTHPAENVLEYSFRILLGDHGLFAFTPVLFWIVYALINVVRQRGHWLQIEAVAVSTASLTITLYILLFTDNFGGEAFGPRWFISMTPVLFFFAAAPSLYRSSARWVFAALSVFSVLSAWQGASGPWHSALPLLRLETSASSLTWPQPLTSAQLAERSVHPLDVTFEGVRARLRGYTLNSDAVQPGEPVTVTLYWQALAPMSNDAALFVHLINSIGAFTAQRDVSPGLRNLPTSHWKPGSIYADPQRLDLAETVYAPDSALVQVGLYWPDGARLAARSPEGLLADGAVKLTTLKLVPRPGNVPNPARINFRDQLALVGYDLNTRVIRPGETLSVTLYWQPLAPIQRDYSVFTHLTDSNSNIVAMNDGMPYTQPKRTSRWSSQMMQEVRPLKVPGDAPAGLYQISLGVFGDEGRLPMVVPDGHQVGEELMLAQVRVER